MSGLRTTKGLVVESYSYPLLKTNSSKFNQSLLGIFAKITIPARGQAFESFDVSVDLSEFSNLFWRNVEDKDGFVIVNEAGEAFNTKIFVENEKEKIGVLFFKTDLPAAKDSVFYLKKQKVDFTEDLFKDYEYVSPISLPRHYTHFNGNEYVDIEDNANLDFSNKPFSISFKILVNSVPSSSSDRPMLFAKGNVSSSVSLCINKNFGTLTFEIDDGTTPQSILSTTDICDFQEHKIEVGRTSSEKIYIKVDGVQENFKDISGYGSISNSGDLNIGGISTIPSRRNFHDGSIWDFNITIDGENLFYLEGYGNNNIAWENKAKDHSAINFDGSNDYIDYGNILNKDITDSFFIEATFSNTGNGWDNIFSKRDNSSPNFGHEIYISDIGKIIFVIDAGNNHIGVSSDLAYNDGKLYKIRVEYDGSTNASGVTMYINGSIIPSTIYVDSLVDGDTMLNSSNLAIGSRVNTNYFNGIIYDVNFNNELIVNGYGNTITDWTDTTNSISPISINGSPNTVDIKNEKILSKPQINQISEPIYKNDAYAYFNGSNSYVDYGNILNKDITDSFFIELIFKTNSTAALAFIGNLERYPPHTGFEITISNGKIVFLLSNDYGNDNTINVSTVNDTYNDNKFHKLKVEYDGSSDANGVDFYIDDILVSKTIRTNSLTSSTLTSNSLLIGTREALDFPFDGVISNVNFNNELIVNGRGVAKAFWSDTTNNIFPISINNLSQLIPFDLSKNNFMFKPRNCSIGEKNIYNLNSVNHQDSNSYLVSDKKIDIAGNDPRTVSMWLKYNTTDNSMIYFFSMGLHSGSRRLFALARYNGLWFFHGYSEDHWFNHSSTGDLKWHKHDLVYNKEDSKIYWYIDTVLLKTFSSNLETEHARFGFGGRVSSSDYNSFGDRAYPIEWQLCTIVKRAKSQAEIETEYKNQINSDFLTIQN